jgi:hypothetical protein
MWMASFGLQTERVRFGWMEGTIFIMTPLMLLRASLTSTPWDSQERGSRRRYRQTMPYGYSDVVRKSRATWVRQSR